MYEKRQEIEEAIASFRMLLEDDGVSEAQFQEWFDHHPVIFRALNYKAHVSHPVLRMTNGRSFVPDFLVQKISNVWEIFELKIPGTRILKNKETRQTFYASLEEYIQQCVEYGKFFNEENNRHSFSVQTGLSIDSRPQAKLIAGRSNGINRYKLIEMLGDRGHWVDIITYDDIYDQLQFYKLNALPVYESLPGMLAHMVVIIKRMYKGERNYLMAVGGDGRRNSLSVYIDHHANLIFEIISADGKIVRSTVSLKAANISYKNPTYLTFELGISDKYAVLSIEVNGVYHSFINVDPMNINLSSDVVPVVIGSDHSGRGHGRFDLFECILFNQTLNIDDRYKLRKHVYWSYINGESLLKIRSEPRARIEDGRFFRTNEHPNFLFDDRYSPMDMIQPITDKQPEWYYRRGGKRTYMTAFFNQMPGEGRAEQRDG